MSASIADYSVDTEAGERVGKVIGDTARQEERKIRASDSRGHSRDRLPDKHPKVPNFGLWIVFSTVSLCMAVLLLILAVRISQAETSALGLDFL